MKFKLFKTEEPFISSPLKNSNPFFTAYKNDITYYKIRELSTKEQTFFTYLIESLSIY